MLPFLKVVEVDILLMEAPISRLDLLHKFLEYVSSVSSVGVAMLSLNSLFPMAPPAKIFGPVGKLGLKKPSLAS